MEFDNAFEVPLPPAQAWPVLMNVQGIAPCMPGAQLTEVVDDRSYMGEGGTIPFMYMLGEKFPKAQFCITGVLGPGSNAHGPNEFLHLPTARRLTLCIADVLAEHAKQ